MRHDRYDCNFGCPVEAALEVLGGKWKGLILFHLLEGSRRFNDLRRLLPEVTQRMLTRQLRELEADGIVARQVFAEVPPHVEYSLTEFGESLAPLMSALQQWGGRFLQRQAALRDSTP